MALHRDIFWVGRQWAVTGSGIQAVDQRLRGILDIEIARLWDDDLIANRRAKPGLNAEDFDKALTLARKRWPSAVPPAASSFPPMAMPLAPGEPPEPPRASGPAPAAPAPPQLRPLMDLRAAGSLARFLPQWRVRR